MASPSKESQLAQQEGLDHTIGVVTDAVRAGYFGKITLHFEAGVVTRYEKNETIKVPITPLGQRRDKVGR